jgi:hypothetical protein
MRVEHVKHSMANVYARVVVVLATCVFCGDGQNFVTCVRDYRPICAIVILDKSSWEFRDGGCGDIQLEGGHVDEHVHCR